MRAWPEHRIIEGNAASIVPLSMEHHDDLVEAVKDGELYRQRHVSVPAPEQMEAEIKRRLDLKQKRIMLPFAVVKRPSQRVVGMTAFLNVDVETRKIEIGSTWYRRNVQRTAINTECKFLMLQYAFEILDYGCVEFRTHILNAAGRKSIERLGARLEGILCSDEATANSFVRDTAIYSIFAQEWPAVKDKLLGHLAMPRQFEPMVEACVA